MVVYIQVCKVKIAQSPESIETGNSLATLHSSLHNNNTHRNACRTVREGPQLPCMLAGAFSLSSTTRTILHRNSKLRKMEIQTGTTRTFSKFVLCIQQLGERKRAINENKRSVENKMIKVLVNFNEHQIGRQQKGWQVKAFAGAIRKGQICKLCAATKVVIVFVFLILFLWPLCNCQLSLVAAIYINNLCRDVCTHCLTSSPEPPRPRAIA